MVVFPLEIYGCLSLAEDAEIAEEYFDFSLRTLRSLRDFIYTTFK